MKLKTVQNLRSGSLGYIPLGTIFDSTKGEIPSEVLDVFATQPGNRILFEEIIDILPEEVIQKVAEVQVKAPADTKLQKPKLTLAKKKLSKE